MEITDELRELILVGASALELRRKAIEEGMITLRGSGLRKIKDGVTTIEEVLRETVNKTGKLMPDIFPDCSRQHGRAARLGPAPVDRLAAAGRACTANCSA